MKFIDLLLEILHAPVELLQSLLRLLKNEHSHDFHGLHNEILNGSWSSSNHAGFGFPPVAGHAAVESELSHDDYEVETCHDEDVNPWTGLHWVAPGVDAGGNLMSDCGFHDIQ